MKPFESFIHGMVEFLDRKYMNEYEKTSEEQIAYWKQRCTIAEKKVKEFDDILFKVMSDTSLFGSITQETHIKIQSIFEKEHGDPI